MKKLLLILFAMLLCVSLVACANTGSKKSYAELESQLESVISERDALQAELEVVKGALEAKNASTKIKDSDVDVVVTDKTVIPENADNWIFSNYVNFVFSITNNTEKDIQGIQGTLTINDLFGVEIMTAECDFTGETIGAHTTVTNDDLSFECNQFMDDHMKVFNTDYRDLNFEYTVKTIVYTDGTVKTLN